MVDPQTVVNSNPWQIVRDFEAAVASFSGAPFAVAVDTGTAAIHLCLEAFKAQGQAISLPKRTYCSVPCAVIHAGGRVRFDDRNWSGDYTLDPTPIVDSACRFRPGMYQAGELRCLSFQTRKRLSIGRGGMILTDNAFLARWLRLARYSGRHEVPLMQDVPEFVGWHCFMESEQAARGLERFKILLADGGPWDDLRFEYPDLSEWGIYDR